MGDQALARALGLALTGTELPLSAPASLPEDLAALGFDAAALQALRVRRQHGRQPCPFPVPLEERRGLGFARFDAALAEARRVLGLTGLTAATPAARPPDRDEQRLLQDRPPHW